MTAEARIYRCSGCGAPAGEGSLRCGYCQAPIATVRCGRCFHMNPGEARHCSACGSSLGLEPPWRESSRRCPACKVELLALETAWGEVLDCGRCGGQFVDTHVLRVLLERPPHPERSRGTYLPENPLAQPVVYRMCPGCAQLMHRKNFGERSGIIIDVCTVHGMWFDRGELPRVLAFVETGGLAQVPAAPRRPPRIVTQSAQSEEAPWVDAVDVAGAVVELVGYVISLGD